MTSLVTGGTGFVGRVLSARLEAAGEAPRIVSRQSAGDIADVTDWSPFVDGVDVVYHLAARVHVMDERSSDAAALYHRTNATVTDSLARAAARAGVRHFVFLSSIKAGGGSSGPQPLREDDAPQPEDHYGRSKLEAERALDAVRAESGMRISILRPPLVYGPGVKANFYRLLSAIDHYVAFPLASIENQRSFVYVENLVDAMIRCVESGADASRTFYVADGEDISTPELIRRTATALGRPAILLPVPVGMLEVVGTILRRRGAVDRLVSSLAADTSAIRESTGWAPRFTMADGLKATAQWYRQSR